MHALPHALGDLNPYLCSVLHRWFEPFSKARIHQGQGMVAMHAYKHTLHNTDTQYPKHEQALVASTSYWRPPGRYEQL